MCYVAGTLTRILQEEEDEAETPKANAPGGETSQEVFSQFSRSLFSNISSMVLIGGDWFLDAILD